MKLIIAGIPGTGKTTIGEYLQAHEAFEHFDAEKARWTEAGIFRPDLDAFLIVPASNKVITWGFVPQRDAVDVKETIEFGYRLIWFDGNRNAARKAFLRRGNVPEHYFEAQIQRIDATD